MNTKTIAICALSLLLGAVTFPATATSYKKMRNMAEQFVNETVNNRTFDVPARGKLEVAFSPNEGSERLVIKVIDSAKKDLRVLSYSFTSASFTEALVRAVHRGVVVRLVADYKNNVVEDRSGKAKAALSALKTAGADVRVIRVYAIHHDKILLVDNKTVELGSLNYSSAAVNKNSENVLVNWDNPDLAAVYSRHFERNYKLSEPYVVPY